MPRLHAAGWSVGEAGFTSPGGTVWQVDGRNGEEMACYELPTDGETVAGE